MTATDNEASSDGSSIAAAIAAVMGGVGMNICALVTGGSGYDYVVELESWKPNVESDGGMSIVVDGHGTDGRPFRWKARRGHMEVTPFGDGTTLVKAEAMPTLLLIT